MIFKALKITREIFYCFLKLKLYRGWYENSKAAPKGAAFLCLFTTRSGIAESDLVILYLKINNKNIISDSKADSILKNITQK